VARLISEARVRAFAAISRWGDALNLGPGMDALRAALAHGSEPTDSPPADAAASLVGTATVAVPAWIRARAGRAPIAPDPMRGTADDFLRMMLGAPAPEEQVRALDAYLVTVSEHGMNASTFAARVVASTGSDMVSAAVAAVGALKGPLHGGAPGPVLDMLDAVGTLDNASAWIASELRAGRRIMGMGHRIYRVRDPRAAVFERQIEKLARAVACAPAGPASTARLQARLALAQTVEHEAEVALSALHPERPLKANVEFFTAVLLEAVGLPRVAFAPTFAVGRMAGWCAHVMEQRATGRLMRPASRYIGPLPAEP
jgi:citrate synthase